MQGVDDYALRERIEILEARLELVGASANAATTLLGDVNGPSNANHVDALSGPGLGAPVEANVAIEWDDGGGTPATAGQLRFPQPIDGVSNSYSVMQGRTAIGHVAPGNLPIITMWENPANQSALQIGDTNWYYTTLVGGANGAVSLAISSAAGAVAAAWIGIRSDGLAYINANGALGNPKFERSDALVIDYALRDEYDWNGVTIIRYGPSVTSAEGRFFDGVNDRRIWEAAQGGGGTLTFGDAGLLNVFLYGQILTCGSANFGLLADSGNGYAALRSIGAPVVQASNPGAARRVSALNALGIVGGVTMPVNTGDGVTHITAAATAPTASSAVGGGIFYIDPADDALKFRGSAGTTTTLGAA